MKAVICDDHVLFAEALAVILRSAGHDVVACVSTPDEAVEAVASRDVDVCVMDLQFPSGSGIQGVADVLAIAPMTRVMVLTGSCDEEELSRAIGAGARGVAMKGDDLHRVIDTLERVYLGEVVLRAPGAQGSIRSATEPPIDRSLARFLTAREREVLKHLVAGETTADLARAMGVRYSTARTHIQNLLTKLGVHSKLEAVAFAVSAGVVEVPDGSSGATRPA
jgi:two-component system, NarL family, nitrate/nitrite response regulator NarL